MRPASELPSCTQVPIGVKPFTFTDPDTGLFGVPSLDVLSAYSVIACTCTTAILLVQAPRAPAQSHGPLAW